MTDVVVSTSKDIAPEAIDACRLSVGWNARGDKWFEVLDKSSFVATIWSGEQLVGFGRIVEDGVMCMFYDLVVHRDFQAMGLGWKLGSVLIEQVKDKGYREIGLHAADDPRLRRAYERAGFVPSDGFMVLQQYMVDPTASDGE